MARTDDTIQGENTAPRVVQHEVCHGDAAPRCIRIQNQISELGRIRDYLQSLCHDFGIGQDLFSMLNLATEEWVVNVISYAYPADTQAPIELSAQAEDDLLILKIKDRGVPFDPTQHPEADVESALEERPIGGLGIHLVRSIMDTMHYERTADGYNILTLTKKIK